MSNVRKAGRQLENKIVLNSDISKIIIILDKICI